MAEWKKICCPVDFSTPSRLAMDSAADLARRWEADLILVHVYRPEAAPSAERSAARTLEEAAATLDAWRREAEFLASRPVRTVMLEGSAAPEIIEFTRERRFSLIVMGTHGLTGVRRLVLGSVAERVVHQATCSVLVVRPMLGMEDAERTEERS